LRLEGAFLRLCDQQEAILSLILTMVRTPEAGFKGCSRFGLRDYFYGAKRHPELPQAAVEALNDALKDLGILNYSVESIRRASSRVVGADDYVVTFISSHDRTRQDAHLGV
jgi:hypothetical protein